MMRSSKVFIFAALAAVLWPVSGRAAVRATQSFPAVAAAHPLPLDATLSDPLWATGALPLNDFQNVTTRTPSRFRTSVFLLYDAKNLYVGFKSEQPSIAISATQTTNDVGFGIDDFVGIGIDTSGNGTQAYYFETTPRGVRYQQANETARYRPQWQSAAKVIGDTWNAVMIIPFSALRIHAAPRQSWRLNFVRQVSALGEHHTWAYDGIMQDQPASQWPSFYDVRFWPTLSDLRIATGGGGVRSRPRAELYALESVGRDRNRFAQPDGSFRPETVRNLGVDLTYPITNTINFVGTANPDFSNVEIDQQTIAPQEFRRNLQEYRPFFAQGANFISGANAAPVGGFVTPQNLIFYSPSVGPFDRGAKVEGTFGRQSFGLLSFRGHDQVTGNEFDDTAFGYKHALQDRTFLYWADGVLAHHSVSGSDTTAEAGVAGRNLKTGFVWALNHASETGTWLPTPGFAHSSNGFVDVHKPNYEVYAGYQDLSPNYNPIDGFTVNSDVRGPQVSFSLIGSGKGVKNWNLFSYADRFIDRSGAVHQADSALYLSATFKNQFSLNGAGPTVGLLRNYQLPEGSDCGGPVAGRSYFTGFPCYLNGRTDRFNLLSIPVGYRDNTSSPIDASFNGGPFGPFYLHQYTLSTSRQLGSRYSLSIEYDGSYERSFATGALESQWLRRISFGRSFGPSSNLSLGLRAINGNGGFALPGLNFAASYHRILSNNNELFVNYGTPAAYVTLNRLVVKYVLRFGGGAGT